jgi:DNA-binding XRE family transcriptional regulator
MKVPISELTIEGREYYVIPKELIEQEAPHLLEGRTPRIPDNDNVPWKVLRRHLDDEGVSMVQAWREYLGLTQQEVADRMSVSQAAYQQSEKAKRPRKETREKIAKALGIRLSQLH